MVNTGKNIIKMLNTVKHVWNVIHLLHHLLHHILLFFHILLFLNLPLYLIFILNSPSTCSSSSITSVPTYSPTSSFSTPPSLSPLPTSNAKMHRRQMIACAASCKVFDIFRLELWMDRRMSTKTCFSSTIIIIRSIQLLFSVYVSITRL